MKFFSSTPKGVPSPIRKLMDIIYRISTEELVAHFLEEFHVNVVAAAHQFKEAPDKIGVDEVLQLFPNDSDKDSQLSRVVFKNPPVTITRNPVCGVFRYETAVQTFAVRFEGKSRDVSRLITSLTSDTAAYITIFLYVLNRHRAAQILDREAEVERTFIAALSNKLRKSDDPATALSGVCSVIEFDEAACLVYAPYTKELVPLITSSPERKLHRISVDSLNHWASLINSDNGIYEADLTAVDGTDCNCGQFVNEGYTQALFVQIGHEADGDSVHDENYPRAILAVYRKERRATSEREALLLQYTARELAAWIDDIDERIEHRVLRSAISITDQYCSVGHTAPLRREILTPILQAISAEISEALRAIPQAPELPNFSMGFIAGGNEYGKITEPVRKKISELCDSESEDVLFIMRLNDDESVIADFRMGPALTTLTTMSQPDYLTFIRPHVYRWIGSLIKLVYQLVLLEERRVQWVHKTIHEIRHPLQGMITFGFSMRTRLQSAKESRVSLVHYLEDMETSVERMKRMLTVMETASGLDSFVISPKLTYLRDSVFRPIRRILESYAYRKNVTIGEAKNYHILPQIRTDADALSHLFYNLLDNAIKYSDQGGAIEIECLENIKGNEWWIDVVNYGEPIISSDATRVFENDFRGQNASDAEVGLGMGLHVASVLAEKLSYGLSLVSRGDQERKIVFRLKIPKK